MNTNHHPPIINVTTVRREVPGSLAERRFEDRIQRLARRRRRQAQIAAIALRVVGRPGT